MINIYENTAESFTTQGLGILTPSSCIAYEEINGEYYIELTHKKDAAGRWKHISRGRIITVPTPDGIQPFRIVRTVKNLSNEITVRAEHIFYDLLKNFVESVDIVQISGNTAMSALKNGLSVSMPFVFSSNITSANSAYWVRQNPVSCIIGDQDNSFIRIWGGEIYRNRYDVSMMQRRGADNGVEIRYAKNLTGLSATEDDTDVYTRIYGTALDNEDTIIPLPEKYIDSALISSYPYPMVGYKHFEDIKLGAEDEDGNIPYSTLTDVYAEIRRRINLLYSNGIDKPSFELDVSFIDLGRTSEYAQYKSLEKVSLGDTVHVKHLDYDINYSLRMFSYSYDCLKERYEHITLGELPYDLSSNVRSSTIDISELQKDLTTMVKQGSKYNHVSISHAEGFVSETADKKCKTTQNGAGFIAEQKLNNKTAKTVITGGEPLSVYYNGKLIGGAKIVNDKLVFCSDQLTTADSENVYGTIGKVTINNHDYYGLFLYDSNSVPFIRIRSTDNNGVWMYSNGDIQIGTGSSVTVLKSGEIDVDAQSSPLLLSGIVLNLQGCAKIKPSSSTEAVSESVTLQNGSSTYTLTFSKGLLVSITRN